MLCENGFSMTKGWWGSGPPPSDLTQPKNRIQNTSQLGSLSICVTPKFEGGILPWRVCFRIVLSFWSLPPSHIYSGPTEPSDSHYFSHSHLALGGGYIILTVEAVRKRVQYGPVWHEYGEKSGRNTGRLAQP